MFRRLMLGCSEESLPLLFPGFFIVFWLAVSCLISFMLGIFKLYHEYPRDDSDIIDESFRWVSVQLGSPRGHAPMNLRLGRKALHTSEPILFQPLFGCSERRTSGCYRAALTLTLPI
jgi:hypothetical protein